MAEPSLKDQGNDEYKKGNFLKAAGLYSKAIRQEPDNAVLYSNRCAALLKLTKISRALEDAEHCIRLKPEWHKGYFRKGAVHEYVKEYKEALEAYQEAHQRNPDNSEVSSKVRTLQKFIKALGKQPDGADTAASRDRTASAAKPKAKAKAGSAFKLPPAPAAKAPAAEPTAADAEAPAAYATGAGAAGAGADAEPQQKASSLKQLSGPVADFVEEWMSHAVATINDGSVSPTIHFLPGSPAEPMQEGEDNIRASNAFDSPAVLQDFCNFLAGMRQKLDARAICAILPKAAISCPEVWRKAGWPCGSSDGVFFQLLSTEARSIMFIPLQGGTPRPPVELDTDFGILPWSLAQ